MSYLYLENKSMVSCFVTAQRNDFICVNHRYEKTGRAGGGEQ